MTTQTTPDKPAATAARPASATAAPATAPAGDTSMLYSAESERMVIALMFNPAREDIHHKLMQLLAPDDFHVDQNQSIWQIIGKLRDAGLPGDPIGVLDNAAKVRVHVGGAGYIADTANDPIAKVCTNEAGMAAADRVKQFSMTRRLLKSLTTGVVLCQSGGTYAQVMSFVEEEMSNLRRTATSSSTGPQQARVFYDAILAQMDAKEEGIESNDVVPTGFPEFDAAMGGGLPKGAVVAIAGRPGMGKSAFATAIEQAISSRGIATLIFSTEMPGKQIAQRNLARHSRIPLTRIKSLELQGDDYERFVDSYEVLANAPAFIDDTPGLTIADIRSRARAFAQKYPNLVIMIDYLQQVSPSNSKDDPGRTVSEASKGTLLLARELKCPVVNLAQLNRGVESRANKRPMLSDLKECVVGDTYVLLADGRRVCIKDLVGLTPEVLALDQSTLKLVPATALEVWPVGQREIIELTTGSGKQLRCTPEHLVLTEAGWAEAAAIPVGARIAAARVTNCGESTALSEAQAELLGHLIGDGSYLPGTMIRYTNGSPENIADVVRCASALGYATRVRPGPTGTWSQVEFMDGGSTTKPGKMRTWLKELGIYGQRSPLKRIPSAVFGTSERLVCLVLQGLWATDGCYYVHTGRGKHETFVYYATHSRLLAADVVALLLQLGIAARLKRYGRDIHVKVTGDSNVRLFLDKIRPGAAKAHQASGIREALSKRTGRANTNVDTVPRALFVPEAKRAAKQRGLTHKQLASRRGTSYGGGSHFRFSPSRDVVLNYAEILDDEPLRLLGQSDIFWDKLQSSVAAGTEQVFDLTVPGPSNWLADGIVCHNSGQIEQDSAIIVFLYRDEYYNPDSPDRGVTEAILGKNRDGATCTDKFASTLETMHYTELGLARGAA